jgi:hypothetical protein
MELDEKEGIALGCVIFLMNWYTNIEVNFVYGEY